MLNRNSLNGGNFGAKIPRYEELAIPKIRVDQTSHNEPFKVKRRALSYQITDSLNKLAQPRRCQKSKDNETQRKTTLESKNLNSESENEVLKTNWKSINYICNRCIYSLMMSHSAKIVRTPRTMSSPSVRVSSSSSSSDDEMFYGKLQTDTVTMQRRSRKQDKTWNYPRKTIKAIDSMGGIAERGTAPNKFRKKIDRQVKLFKRLLELAKPRSVASNRIEDSVKCSKEQKSCVPKHRFASGLHSVCQKRILESTENLTTCSKTLATRNPASIVYKATEHTAKLAEPRVRHEVEIRLPGKVVESALFATASKRLIELATPKSSVRANLPELNIDTAKRTASGVSREALRAECSPRILKLAEPRNPKTLMKSKETKVTQRRTHFKKTTQKL